MSSLYRPRTHPERMVEAPGTAPGSTTLIPTAVYHHSRCYSMTKVIHPTPDYQTHPQDACCPLSLWNRAGVRETKQRNSG